MARDFETDADFQRELDWVDDFVEREVEPPLDLMLGSEWGIHAPRFYKLVRPLQAQVRERRLWARHVLRTRHWAQQVRPAR